MIERPAPGQASSPRIRRATRAASIATTLRRSLVDHGVSHSAAALALGVPRQRLDEWRDPDVEGQLRAADMPLPGAVSMSGPKAAARFVREGGEGAAVTIEALADDGAMSPAEGAKVEHEMDDVIEAAVTLREFAREAQKVPVRRIGEARRA